MNDLSTPGASTFEPLGVLHYDHHARIHLKPGEYNGRVSNNRKIPTDGLVLRGFYNAITLAVYGTLSKSTAEQLAQAAQQQNTTSAEDDSQIILAPNVSASRTSSIERSQDNHGSPLTGAQTATDEQQKPSPKQQQAQPSQYNRAQNETTASWVGAASQNVSHDIMVDSWASTAAANLHQQQHQIQSTTASIPTAGNSANPGTRDICAASLNDANVPPPLYQTNELLSGNAQGPKVEQNIEHYRGLSTLSTTEPLRANIGEEWYPVNGGVGTSTENRQRTSSEKSVESMRSKALDRQPNITDHGYLIQSHSSVEGQVPRSPIAVGLLEERGCRPGREQDSVSSRGRSRTPTSRSRSPHSGHGRSITPESRLARNRRDRTPTSNNIYDSQGQVRALPFASRSPSVGPSTPFLSRKAEQSDSIPEGDILDDVSDISDGDIPDIPATSDKEINEDKEGQHAVHIDTASSDQVRE